VNLAQDACSRRANVAAGPLPPSAPPDRDVPDCSNWAVSASWEIPSSAPSGVYLARVFETADRDNASHIPFVVNEGAGPPADVLYQLSDATWQAYNRYDDAVDGEGNPLRTSFYNPRCGPSRTIGPGATA
jgi:hypothetical protein